MPLKSILLLFLITIPETPVPYGCTGGQRAFYGSTFNLPPSKELSVSLTIMPTNQCSVAQDFNLLVVWIFPSSLSSAPTPVMIITYYGSQGKIVFRSQDLFGVQTTQLVPLSSANFWNRPINLYVTANLATGSCSFNGGGTFDTISNSFLGAVSYGSDWIFDSSTRIDICSDYGANLIGCTVQNLKVTYSYYSLSGVLNLANTVRILADYKMNDGSGVPPTDSQGTLGSALPFVTAPSWNSETGLQFTSSNQYFQLPSFIPSASDLTITTSLSFSFYLTIDQVPTTDSYIFYYWCNQPQMIIWSLQVTSRMKLKANVEGVTHEGSLTLNVGEWYWIYASFAYTDGGLGLSQAYVNGGGISLSPYTTASPGTSRLTTSDVIRVGLGFIGKLRRMQIYSPSALSLNPKPCDSTACAVDIGFNTPPLCVRPVCNTPGYYPSVKTCESCPTRCASCSDPISCHSCIVGYYLDGTACKSCPMHCESCSDSQTCQSCSSGYGIINNLCVLCPAGTYLDSSSSKFCQKLSPALQNTLTNSQLTNSAATQAAGLLSKGSSVSLSAMIGGKIFSQIKYLDISYSGELQVALLTWLTSFVSLGLTPNIPDSIIEKIPERHVPSVFERYGLVSSFVVNFWENLGIVVFVTILWMLFKGLELSFEGKKALFSRKIRVMIQNFLIAVMFGVYGDLVMFALIEYRSLVFGWNLSLLSFTISILLIVTMFFTFWYQTRLLLAYQRIKNHHPQDLEKFKTAHEGSQVLFKDFKDDSLAPQLFFFFLNGRDIIFSFMLAIMFEHPLAQILLIIILDFLMIAYLFIKKPFQSTFDFFQQLFFEFVGLIVNITILVNAILDSGNYEAAQARYNIGKLIIISNMIFNFVTAIFMFIVIVQNLLEFYRQQKQKQAKKLRVLQLQNRLQRPPPSVEESNQRNKLLHSEQSLIQETSNNNIETISFRQESFDLGGLSSQIQSNTHLRRRLKNNPQRGFQNTPNEIHIPSLNLNQESQRRVNLASHNNALPITSLVSSSLPKDQTNDRITRHEKAHQERIKSRAKKLYN